MDMIISDYIKTKDLSTITGKSLRQCERDMKRIRELNRKTRGQLIKIQEVAKFYGLTEYDVKTRLLTINQVNLCKSKI